MVSPLMTSLAALGLAVSVVPINRQTFGTALRHPLVTSSVGSAAISVPFKVHVEAEEIVCELPRYETTNNGSGMFWSSGSAQMVRLGDRLFVSAFEAVPEAAPLNNARWALYERRAEGWILCQRDQKDRTREPCSLAISHAGRLVMSANPTLAPFVPAGGKTAGGPARPEFLVFDPAHPEQAPAHLVPQWNEEQRFTEHTYRAFSADGARGEFILFNKVGSTHTAWALLDADRTWTTGQLNWPQGEDPKYAVWNGPLTPVNYANVILKDRQVHYLGLSPINIWNRIDPLKKETWGRDHWGWRMRKLHYAWTPDIKSRPFGDWVVLDDTMDDGWIANSGGEHDQTRGSSPALLAEVDRVLQSYTVRAQRPLNHARDFFDCIKSRRLTVANPEAMHAAMTTVHAANICMWLKRDLKYDPAKEEFLNDSEANRLRSRAMREPWVA